MPDNRIPTLENLEDLLVLGVYVTLSHATTPEFHGLAALVDKVWCQYEERRACAILEKRGDL